MFVGHGMAAFAIVALTASALGWSRERALVAALAAGAFGLAPDVDMLYAPVGILGAETVLGAAEGFWASGNVVHRAVTHSLVVGPIVAAAAALWTVGGRGRWIGLAAGAGLVAVAVVASGPLGAAVMAAFVAASLAIAAVASDRGLDAATVGVVALVGFVSHPFGDLLTGTPPAFLYPLDVTLVAARPAPFADPTLNLLAPLFLELWTLWLALFAYAGLDGFSLREFVDQHLDGRVTVAAGFGAAVLLPAPTLELSYHFVFPLVGVGLLLAAPVPAVDVRRIEDLRAHPPRAGATGLAAVSLAAAAYTVVYLAV